MAREIVTQRTMFMDNTGGRVTFSQFNLINVRNLGACVEPRQMDLRRQDNNQTSMDDDLTRVDEVAFKDRRETYFVDKHGTTLHGGMQVFETGL